MSEQTKDTLKGYFLTSFEPNQDQYTDLIDTLATETELSIAISGIKPTLQDVTDNGDKTKNDIILQKSALKIDNDNSIQTVLIDQTGFHVTSEDQNSSINVTLGGIVAIDGIHNGQLTLTTIQTDTHQQTLQDASGTVALVEKGVIVTKNTILTSDSSSILLFTPTNSLRYAISDIYVICPSGSTTNVNFSIGSNLASFNNMYGTVSLTASMGNDNLINVVQPSIGVAVGGTPIYAKITSATGAPYQFELITKGFYI